MCQELLAKNIQKFNTCESAAKTFGCDFKQHLFKTRIKSRLKGQMLVIGLGGCMNCQSSYIN